MVARLVGPARAEADFDFGGPPASRRGIATLTTRIASASSRDLGCADARTDADFVAAATDADFVAAVTDADFVAAVTDADFVAAVT